MDASTLPKEAYLMFCGGIDQASAQRIMHALDLTSQEKRHAHILFQSSGGIIGDGVCLHNYLESYPGEVTLYNVGTIASMGLLAYLGAKNRVAHKHSTFMMHSPTAPAVAMSPQTLDTALAALTIDERRIKEITEARVSITPEQWSHLRHNELWFTAEDALKSGIATRIANFSPPAGSPVYTI